MNAKINGTTIFFDVEGKQFVADGPVMRKKPVCFLAHGGPGCDHTQYLPALTQLADVMQLVYFDHRGSGRSGYPDPATYTLEQNVKDIEALRQYLGLEKIVLLGQSYGGMVAQKYAIEYGQNLEALILITTAPSWHYIEKAREELKKKGTPAQQQMGEYLFTGSFTDNQQFLHFFKLFGNLYSVSSYNEVRANEAYERMIVSAEALNRGMVDGYKRFDFREELGSITAPTLLLGAQEDWITPIEQTHIIAQKMPKVEMKILENSSHNVWGDAPEATYTAIRNFLMRICPIK